MASTTLPVDAEGLPIVSLTIGDIAMSLAPSGIWSIHSDVLHQYARKEEVVALSTHLSAISSQQQALEDEMKALEQERQELLLKNSILIDMVSETDAALDKATEELDREKLKVEALKWKVARDNLMNTR